MPTRLASSQLMVVRQTRVRYSMEGVDGIHGAKGERADSFHLSPSVVPLQQGGIAGIHPEDRGNRDHENNGERAAAPCAGGNQRCSQIQSRSLHGHESPPGCEFS